MFSCLRFREVCSRVSGSGDIILNAIFGAYTAYLHTSTTTPNAKSKHHEAKIEFAYAMAHVFAHTGLHTARCPVGTPRGLHGKRVIPW